MAHRLLPIRAVAPREAAAAAPESCWLLAPTAADPPHSTTVNLTIAPSGPHRRRHPLRTGTGSSCAAWCVGAAARFSWKRAARWCTVPQWRRHTPPKQQQQQWERHLSADTAVLAAGHKSCESSQNTQAALPHLEALARRWRCNAQHGQRPPRPLPESHRLYACLSYLSITSTSSSADVLCAPPPNPPPTGLHMHARHGRVLRHVAAS